MEGSADRGILLVTLRAVAATRVYHRAARDLYDKELPTMIYIEGTDEIGHFFAPFAEPRLTCVSDQDFVLYHRTVETYYALVDQLLGQWNAPGSHAQCARSFRVVPGRQGVRAARFRAFPRARPGATADPGGSAD